MRRWRQVRWWRFSASGTMGLNILPNPCEGRVLPCRPARERSTAGGLRILCREEAGSGTALAPRSERLALSPPDGLDNRLPGEVEFVSYLGAVIELRVRLSPADRVVVEVPNRGDPALPRIGDTVAVGWPREAGLVFAE